MSCFELKMIETSWSESDRGLNVTADHVITPALWFRTVDGELIQFE